jgi:glucose-1-phosphatase
MGGQDSSKKISTVIFDLGKVLIDFDHMIAARALAPHTEKAPEEIYSLFFDSEVTGLFEEGKISPSAFYSRVSSMLGLSIGYEQFTPIWNGIFMFNSENKKVYDFARLLRRQYTVALLSNINELHLQYIKSTFGLFDAFDVIMTSCGLGARKPDPAIYHAALAILQKDPEECFYTDDRPELVASARSLGIRSHVYAGFEDLKKAFAAAGGNVE